MLWMQCEKNAYLLSREPWTGFLKDRLCADAHQNEHLAGGAANGHVYDRAAQAQSRSLQSTRGKIRPKTLAEKPFIRQLNKTDYLTALWIEEGQL